MISRVALVAGFASFLLVSVAGCRRTNVELGSPAPVSSKVGVSGPAQESKEKTTPAPVEIGGAVPDFELNLSGTPRRLTELQRDRALTRDGTLLFMFWSSTCDSCRGVDSAFEQLVAKYRGTVGVFALNVNLSESADSVQQFLSDQNLSFLIAFDPSGRSADLLGARVTTTSVVLDQQGVLRYRGRFDDGTQPLAAMALEAVLAHQDVPIPETKQKG